MGIGCLTNWGDRSEAFALAVHGDTSVHRYLVDAGCAVVGKQWLNRWLPPPKLDCFVISHGDRDHVGLASFVVSHLKPAVVVVAPLVYAEERLRNSISRYMAQQGPPSGPGGQGPNPIPRQPTPDDAVGASGSFVQALDRDYERLDPPPTRGNDQPPGGPAATNASGSAGAPTFLRRGVKPGALPWHALMRPALVPEFETYCTKSQTTWATDIERWSAELLRKGDRAFVAAIRAATWLPTLPNGYVATPMTAKEFQLILGFIRTHIRNERSLICRVGRAIMTGDASAAQLQEVEQRVSQVCGRLRFRHASGWRPPITVKINHHGSMGTAYKCPTFFSALQPDQILLKRDDRVNGQAGLNLVKTACRPTTIVDSVSVPSRGVRLFRF